MSWLGGMVRALGMVGLLSLVAVGAAPAQTAAEVQRTLEDTLQKKELPIRDFIGDTVIRYAWKTDHFEHPAGSLFAFGVFQTKSVKVHDTSGMVDRVTIKGMRRVVMRGGKSGILLSAAESPVTFEVDLQGAAASGTAQVVNGLFYADVDAALAGVPPQFASMVPFKQSEPGTGCCGGAKKVEWIEENGAWRALEPGVKLRLPDVLSAPEPEFSEEARRAKVNGHVMVGLVVGSDGLVRQVWLLQPLGFGLDEPALKTASQYRFAAREYQGTRIGYQLKTEISFQIR